MSPRRGRTLVRLAQPMEFFAGQPTPEVSGGKRFSVWLHQLLTHDYCPGANRYLRFFYTPLGVLLLAALAAGLCGWFLHPHGFVLLAGLAAIIVLGLFWPWISTRGLSGELHFGRTRVHEGEPVTARLELRNRALWSVWGLKLDLGLPAAAKEAAGLAQVPPWRRVDVEWQLCFDQRGEYPTGHAWTKTGFPFGLWRTGRRLAVPHRLLVWPSVFAVGTIPFTAGERSFDGTVFHNRPGIGGDLLGARPYRRGDSLRRIHWGQTARHDRLITCEFQASSLPWIQVVLDVDPAAHGGKGAQSSREWSIRVAASLCRDWIAQGALVGLVFAGQAWPAESGGRHLHKLLDALARIGPETGIPLPALVAQPACTGFEGGLQVVITTDRALVRHGVSRTRDRGIEWIIMRAAAFESKEAAGSGESVAGRRPELPPLPFRPWVEVDDPHRVAAIVRAAVEGGVDAR